MRISDDVSAPPGAFRQPAYCTQSHYRAAKSRIATKATRPISRPRRTCASVHRMRSASVPNCQLQSSRCEFPACNSHRSVSTNLACRVLRRTAAAIARADPLRTLDCRRSNVEQPFDERRPNHISHPRDLCCFGPRAAIPKAGTHSGSVVGGGP